jgi:hypothetical protein
LSGGSIVFGRLIGIAAQHRCGTVRLHSRIWHLQGAFSRTVQGCSVIDAQAPACGHPLH